MCAENCVFDKRQAQLDRVETEMKEIKKNL